MQVSSCGKQYHAAAFTCHVEATCSNILVGMQGGEVRSQWAGRSVIASAGKLAYGHAQAVIDGAPPPEAPAQLHGGHSWEQARV